MFVDLVSFALTSEPVSQVRLRDHSLNTNYTQEVRKITTKKAPASGGEGTFDSFYLSNRSVSIFPTSCQAP